MNAKVFGSHSVVVVVAFMTMIVIDVNTVIYQRLAEKQTEFGLAHVGYCSWSYVMLRLYSLICHMSMVKSIDSNSFIHGSYDHFGGSSIQAVFLSSSLWKLDDIS